MLCALCAAAAVTDRYANYSRRLEAAFRTDLERQNTEKENR